MRARAAFTPDVLEWFNEMSRAEHHPLSWASLKQRLITRFTSAFSTQQLWHQLASLQRGEDINEYHRRFIELIRLVGETPSSVLPGSQAFNIYEEKMDPVARHTWSVIAVLAKFTNQALSLRHIMMVAEEEFEKTAAGLPSVSISRSGVVAAALPADPVAVPGTGCVTTTNPDPIEPGAMRSPVSLDRCARCGGKGHWADQCSTPQAWKEGDQVAMPPRRGCRGKGNGSGRGGWGGNGSDGGRGSGGGRGRSTGGVVTEEADKLRQPGGLQPGDSMEVTEEPEKSRQSHELQPGDSVEVTEEPDKSRRPHEFQPGDGVEVTEEPHQPHDFQPGDNACVNTRHFPPGYAADTDKPEKVAGDGGARLGTRCSSASMSPFSLWQQARVEDAFELWLGTS